MRTRTLFLAGLSCLVFPLAACSSGSSDPGTNPGVDTGTPGDDSTPPDDSSTTDGIADATDAPSVDAPPPGPCTVKKGTAGVAIKGTLLSPSGPTYGEVLVGADGKIACVDASCATNPAYAAATQIECPSGVVSPGLINAHDHTEYGTVGPIAHATTRWQHRNGWRTGAAPCSGCAKEPKLSGTPKSTTDVKIIAASELRFVLGGATSVVGSGAAPGLMRNLAAFKDEAKLEGLTGATVFFDTFPLGDSSGTELSSGCGYPSIRSVSSAFSSGGSYSPHISEGINLAAENEFTCLKGSLITAQTAIIHGVGLNANDVDVIAKAKAKVVWSARTNVDLYGNTAPIPELKRAGITIALGTDWLASGSMNMLRELQCADSLNQKYFAKTLTDRELWEAATKNAAIATKFDSQIGELKVGLVGDIAVFDGTTNKDYRAVIDAGVEDVKLVLRGGKPLYGDADLTAALATTCGALDVCGSAKSVCLDVPGVALADVQASATAIYPLFFCKGTTPTNEPSCIPYRDTYPAGTSATDRDGDGIADATDICPDVFDPIRTMDGTKQSDVDSDGAGDACDSAPLDPATK